MVKNRVGGEQKTLLRAQQWPLEEGSLPEEKKKKIPGYLESSEYLLFLANPTKNRPGQSTLSSTLWTIALPLFVCPSRKAAYRLRLEKMESAV